LSNGLAQEEKDTNQRGVARGDKDYCKESL